MARSPSICPMWHQAGGVRWARGGKVIPVTRVSNGKGGRADLILTKVSRPPPLCHQCTAELSSLVELIPAVTAMPPTTLVQLLMEPGTELILKGILDFGSFF